MASLHEDPGPKRRRTISAEDSPLRMARLIEGEIIPRLLLAHRADPVAVPSFDAAEPLAFAHRTLQHEVFALLTEVDAHLARGVPIAAIYLGLLAPTARVLGEFWENDVCDFVDVTMGMWRLQQLIHQLCHRGTCAALRSNRRILLTVPPGDQHSFGLVMIEDFFRRAGWHTWSAAAAPMSELCAMVAGQWFELIGISVSAAEQMAALPAVLVGLRAASCNPAVGIMVGGQVFTDHPEWAAGVGADATASDAAQAIGVAERLVETAGRLAGH
ncbi:MAG: cobalamin B12-binding domain-containing protein [Sphingomonadaceae bacterium]|nr:cobalamin B12-binding domain-containing protein [Sphingomonadaceae bacterium]